MRLLFQLVINILLLRNLEPLQGPFRQTFAAQPGPGQGAVSPQQQMPEHSAQAVAEAALTIYSIEQLFQLVAAEIFAPRLLTSFREPETAVAVDQAVFTQKAQEQPFELRAAGAGLAQEIADQTVAQMTPDHARAGVQSHRDEDGLL